MRFTFIAATAWAGGVGTGVGETIPVDDDESSEEVDEDEGVDDNDEDVDLVDWSGFFWCDWRESTKKDDVDEVPIGRNHAHSAIPITILSLAQ